MSDSIAIVGASLAGLRTAEQLRAAGHTGPITVYGAEPHPPYNRPPLSKEVLAAPAYDDAEEGPVPAMLSGLTFRRRASIEDVEFILGAEVTHADLAARTLTWRDSEGSEHTAPFDALVVATGLRPRRLSSSGPTDGRYVLRTVEDCAELRRALQPGGLDVVVIGAGFIGCETACTLTKLGHRVTVVEPTGAPMNRVLGTALAEAIQAHHEARGIRFVIGPGVAGFTGEDRVTGVVLDDGTTIAADLVVESVGSICNVEWLAGNGLDLSDGVLVDQHLLAVTHEAPDLPPVVAVGDVARFPNALFDAVPRRVEHWSIPTDTAKRAAASLVARLNGSPLPEAEFAPVPSFWSDQGELRFQSFGSPALADEIRIAEGELSDLLGGVLVTYLRAGAQVGSVAINLPPARQRTMREELLAQAPNSAGGNR
jgi:NADPH-dependent 2,4-dienoyl-CoA reductase/sulfur reductase-like enzyme